MRNRPTLDDYFTSIDRLASLVRQAFDKPKSVPRDDLLKALEAFERISKQAGGGSLSQRSKS